MISSNQDIALLNLKTFRDEAVVRHYVRSTGLQGAEIGILSRIQSTFRHKRILDIGVGGGRTTLALLNISKDYIGIDISPEMITEFRRCYPSIAFEVCDARELSRFPNESFDLVFFSYNGIDSIGHSDRLRALREIYRVLARGGAFAFSSHNRRGLIRRPWTRYYVYRKANPLRHPRQFYKLFMDEFVPDCCGHFRNRRHEIQSDEFAIINDEAHHFTFLTYYITLEGQISQARTIGFQEIEAVDFNGNWLLEADYLTCSDAWIYYLCYKDAEGEGSSLINTG